MTSSLLAPETNTTASSGVLVIAIAYSLGPFAASGSATVASSGYTAPDCSGPFRS